MAFATAQDVLDVTGRSVSSAQIRQSQAVIEAYVGRDENDTLDDADRELLKRAVIYQTIYDEDMAPARRGAPGVERIDQGDLSVTFDTDKDTMLSPLAVVVLRRLSWAGSRNVTSRSMYTRPTTYNWWTD